MKKFLTMILCVLAVSAVASASTIPAWRGLPNTTHQIWEFDTPANPTAPDVDNNPMGAASSLTLGSYPKTIWLASEGGASGVWRTEEYIELTIPNFPDANPEKLIRLVIDWSASATPDVYTNPFWSTQDVVSETPIPGTDFVRTVIDMVIEPNPPIETIAILPHDCTLFVDRIEVDTYCVPEPATMSLLGLGAVAFLRRRRA